MLHRLGLKFKWPQRSTIDYRQIKFVSEHKRGQNKLGDGELPIVKHGQILKYEISRRR